MASFHLIRFGGGGPKDGNHMPPIGKFGWPLPDQFPFEGGVYVKVSQSDLKDDSHPHVARGAEYHWQPSGVN